MSDKMLRLQVVFAALDKLSAPLRKLRAGSKGLAESMADTRKQIAGLKKAQLQLAQFRGAEGRFQKSAAELAPLTARVKQLREEMAKVETPTKKMATALAAAEKAEASAIARHEEHGRRLQELSRGLEAAGADVANLARYEDRLADQLRDANREFERQHQLSQRIQRMRQRGEAVRNVGGRIAGADRRAGQEGVRRRERGGRAAIGL
jgi:chromosome segregation ATPase